MKVLLHAYTNGQVKPSPTFGLVHLLQTNRELVEPKIKASITWLFIQPALEKCDFKAQPGKKLYEDHHLHNHHENSLERK